MKYYWLCALILLQISLPAQKLIKVSKKDDPPNTARITGYEVIAQIKEAFVPKRDVSFRVIETDSGTIQLHLECQAGGGSFNIEKGKEFEIGFTDGSKIMLKTVRYAATTRGSYGTGSQYPFCYANGYFELDKATQELFISKEVQYISLGITMEFKSVKKNKDAIGKALMLFR